MGSRLSAISIEAEKDIDFPPFMSMTRIVSAL